MADDSFKIECPYCTQHIRAFAEHIGCEINCPTCGEMYTIPDPFAGQQADAEPVAEAEAEDLYYDEPLEQLPESSFLTQDDYYALQGEEQETINYISQLDPNLWWECSAMAELISSRLQPLRDSVGLQRDEYFHPGTRDEHIAFVHHLDQRSAEFIDIMNFLCRALTTDLQRAVVRPGLKTIVSAANRVGREVGRIRDYHEFLFEHSLPQEQPFPEIQRILVGWGPFISQQMEACIDQLHQKGAGATGDWGDARLVVSMIPTDIPRFLYLKQQLSARYGRR